MASVASFNEGCTFACLAEADRPNGRDDGEHETLLHPLTPLLAEDLPEGELGRWGNARSDAEFIGAAIGREVAPTTMLAGPLANRLEVSPDWTKLKLMHGDVRVAVRAWERF